MNQVKPPMNMRCLLLGYSFETRSKNRALGEADSIINIDLSINGCSHSKNQFDDMKKKIFQYRKLGFGGFNRLMRFKQSLLFSLSLKKSKALFVECLDLGSPW